MNATIRLTVPYPPSGNRYWRHVRGKVVPSEEAKAYKATLQALCARHLPLLGDVVLTATLFRPIAAGDLGNRLKILEDALQGIAFLDDGQVAEYERVRWAPGTYGAEARVELVLTGKAFATREQANAHALKRSETARKRRATVRKNREAKAAGEAAARRGGWAMGTPFDSGLRRAAPNGTSAPMKKSAGLQPFDASSPRAKPEADVDPSRSTPRPPPAPGPGAWGDALRRATPASYPPKSGGGRTP